VDETTGATGPNLAQRMVLATHSLYSEDWMLPDSPVGEMIWHRPGPRVPA
jgi:hypothetical protein